MNTCKNIEITNVELSNRFFSQFNQSNSFDDCELFIQMKKDLSTMCDEIDDCDCDDQFSCCDSILASETTPTNTTSNSNFNFSFAPVDQITNDDNYSSLNIGGSVADKVSKKDEEKPQPCNALVDRFFNQYKNVDDFMNDRFVDKMKHEMKLMFNNFDYYYSMFLSPKKEGGQSFDFTTKIDREGNGDMKTNRNMVRNMLGLNYYDDSISMWVADMDFQTAPAIKESLKSRIDQGILGYTLADNTYHQSIIDWYKRRHNMHIEKNWLLYSPGTISAIRNSIQALTSPNDGIIIQPPVYFPFESQVKANGRKVLRNELKVDENGRYSIDFEDFENKAKDPNTTMFIMCNPHNPVGQIWSREDVRRMIEITRKYHVIVFSAEVHADIIRKESTFHSVLNMPQSDLTVVATALNKTFNLAGLHLTNLVIKNADLKSKFEKHTGWVGQSPMVLEATKAAYNHSEEWVLEMNRVIDENLNLIQNFMAEKMPKVKFNRPEGTYLTWMDFRGYGFEEQALLEKIADESHLILEGGSMFGEQAKGFVRMNVALPKEMLQVALDRLYNCLETDRE